MSSHLARTEGLVVGLDGPEGLAAQRAARLALQHQLSAVGGRILLADAGAKQKVSTIRVYGFD